MWAPARMSLSAHSAPRPLDRLGVVAMIVICLSWGFNQVATKLALPELGPITQVSARSIVGAAALLLYAWRARPELFRSDGTLVPGLVAGLMFTLEFIAIFVAVKMTTASSAILFFYAAPFFVALGAALWLPGEKARPRQWLGMALAFAGVAAGLLRSTAGSSLSGDLLALLAAAIWGATTILIKTTRLARADPVKTLLYQIVTAALISPGLAYAAGEVWPARISLGVGINLVYQSVWVVALTYPLWFWLLRRYRAAELSAFTFSTPIVGVFAGWLTLGESLTPGFLAALALVAGGILLVNWPQRAAA